MLDYYGITLFAALQVCICIPGLRCCLFYYHLCCCLWHSSHYMQHNFITLLFGQQQQTVTICFIKTKPSKHMPAFFHLTFDFSSIQTIVILCPTLTTSLGTPVLAFEPFISVQLLHSCLAQKALCSILATNEHYIR